MAESMPAIGQLSGLFTEDMKNVLRDKYSPEGKSIDELHHMLYSFRSQFNLAPWNVVTLYFKQLAVEVRSGQKFAKRNAWASYFTKLADYQPEIPEAKKDRWVRLSVTVRRGTELSEPVVVAVHPTAKLCWNYGLEGPVTKLHIDMSDNTRTNIDINWLNKKAAGYIRVGHRNGELFNVEYAVNMKMVAARKARSERQYAERMETIAAEMRGDSAAARMPEPPTIKPAESIYTAAARNTLSRTDALLIRGLVRLGGTLIPAGGEDLLSAALEKLDAIIGLKETPNEN